MLCNAEAYSIFSYAEVPTGTEDRNGSGLAALCETWRRRFDGNGGALPRTGVGSGPADGGSGPYLDVLPSGRRRYGVRAQYLGGGLASPRNPASPADGGGAYLFLLDRLDPDAGLSAAFRALRLNRRERDIVRLLMRDRTNKQIADELGLSLNTIKGYLKILMRRLDVNSRAGVVSLVLGKTPQRAPQPAGRG